MPSTSPVLSLSLAGTAVGVTKVEICLAVRAFPALKLCFPDDSPIVDKPPAVGESVALEWEGQSFACLIAGCDFESDQNQYSVTGHLVSEATLGWFHKSPTVEAGVLQVVYQRSPTEDSGWEFLRRVLGHRVARPHGTDDLEAHFPVGSCILRSARADNYDHLDRMLALLSERPMGALDWCGFDVPAAEDFLRLVGTDAEPVELSPQWSQRGSLSSEGLPARLVGPRRAILRRGLSVVPSAAAETLRAVTRDGAMDAAALLGGAAEVPGMPGPIELGGRRALCRAVTYGYSANGQFDVTLDCVRLPARSSRAVVTTLLTGAFEAWDGAMSDARVLHVPQAGWAVMADTGQQPDASEPGKALSCELLSPSAGRGEHVGLYVKQHVGDHYQLLVVDGQVPQALGMHQVFQSAHENEDLTLSDETLRLVSSAEDSILVARAKGLVDIRASSEVVVQKQVAVSRQLVRSGYPCEFHKTLRVKEESTFEANANVGGDLLVEGKSNTKNGSIQVL